MTSVLDVPISENCETPRRDGAPSLLVAVDVVTPSRAVARVVSAIACSTKATVQVLTVIAGGAQEPQGVQRSTWAGNTTEARRRTLVRALASACPAAARWPVTVGAGDVVSVIAETVVESGVDALVVGLPEHHRESSLRDNIVKRLLRRVNVPVIGIAPTGYRQPRTVIAAVDFTQSSIHAASCAARLIAPGGTLYLAHVGPEFSGTAPETQAMRDDYAQAISGAFGRLVQELGTPPHVHVERVHLNGLPFERLMAFAAEVDADLIAVGSHRMERMISIGRLPVALLRDASRSVLVAPPALASPILVATGCSPQPFAL